MAMNMHEAQMLTIDLQRSQVKFGQNSTKAEVDT